MSGGEQLKIILSLGSNVIAIFSVIFMFYTNSFLVKRRKKELGLYNILGMEKKHIAKILFFETVFTSVISLIIGLLGGIITSKLMFLILLKILDFSVPLAFAVSVRSIIITCILFICIFALTLLYNLFQIKLSNPVELLKGGQHGEKEPKTKILLTFIGIATMGTGYYIAQTTESPLAALSLFFLAVILVIIGTYCLFIAGSIALLKILRKNKRFYYKTKNFTAVSGMIYRMKQNAAGLASICILSTAVLVMLSTTVSLYAGVDDVLKSRFPREINITNNMLNTIEDDSINNDRQEIRKLVKEETEKYNVHIKNVIDIGFYGFTSSVDNNKFIIDREGSLSMNSLSGVYIITLDEYNKTENKSEKLQSNEILFYTPNNNFKFDTVKFNDSEYNIKKNLEDISTKEVMGNKIFTSYYIIVSDETVLREILFGENNDLDLRYDPTYEYSFNIEGSKEAVTAFTQSLNTRIKEFELTYLESRQLERETFYSLYGGLLFLGIFLGTLFLMATVLIIYYKQISEGYDDKERYSIMQKVGMSRKEVKMSINRQVLIVFFLPLLTAVIHIAVAFKVITKLLKVLYLDNVPLFFNCTVGTVLVFGIFYTFIYILTEREYYKIVR